MKKNLRIFGFLLAASLWANSSAFAQMESGSNALMPRGSRNVSSGQTGGSASLPAEIDRRSLKNQMQIFQDILNRSIQQTFERPFSLLQDAKGIYLPGFGVAFHLEVNLHPMRFISPFDPRPYTPEELQKAKESKEERIQQLKNTLSELLLGYGGSLNAMRPEDSLAVVVHLFNLPVEENEGLPMQVGIVVRRRTLLDYQARHLTAEDFRKKESFLEF